MRHAIPEINRKVKRPRPIGVGLGLTQKANGDEEINRTESCLQLHPGR